MAGCNLLLQAFINNKFSIYEKYDLKAHILFLLLNVTSLAKRDITMTRFNVTLVSHVRYIVLLFPTLDQNKISYGH